MIAYDGQKLELRSELVNERNSDFSPNLGGMTVGLLLALLGFLVVLPLADYLGHRVLQSEAVFAFLAIGWMAFFGVPILFLRYPFGWPSFEAARNQKFDNLRHKSSWLRNAKEAAKFSFHRLDVCTRNLRPRGEKA